MIEEAPLRLLARERQHVDGTIAIREPHDRRTVMARITSDGLKLLAQLDEPVQTAHRRQLGHLGRERLRALTELLRISRSLMD